MPLARRAGPLEAGHRINSDPEPGSPWPPRVCCLQLSGGGVDDPSWSPQIPESPKRGSVCLRRGSCGTLSLDSSDSACWRLVCLIRSCGGNSAAVVT